MKEDWERHVYPAWTHLDLQQEFALILVIPDNWTCPRVARPSVSKRISIGYSALPKPNRHVTQKQ
jgi:hypothetical protein